MARFIKSSLTCAIFSVAFKASLTETFQTSAVVNAPGVLATTTVVYFTRTCNK